MLIWQASYFSIMKHTGKIREFIWKQHPFGIMIVYTIGVKAFVSLHYGHFRWSIYKTHKFLYMYILQGNSSGQEIRVHFFTNVQIQICNPKTDIFRSFTKIQKCIVDPNDPQLRWILWIIFKTTYFGYMIRRVSLLWIQKEWIQPLITWNNFNTYSSCLTAL